MKKDNCNQVNGDASLLTVQEIDRLLDSFRKTERNRFLQQTNQITTNVNINEIKKDISYATNLMEEMFNYVGNGGNLPIEEIKADVIPLIKKAAEIPHVYHLFYELQSKDEYTYRHTICVGIISTIIGKWLGIPQEPLKELTLAATLHNIGMSRLDKSILNKPGKLTEEEYNQMKQHTIIGYEILRDIPELSADIAIVALQHHEREDGNGYPLGLLGDQIHRYSKIVAIADSFHAMSSTRVYSRAKPFYEVISDMQNSAFGKLDPNIMLIFLYKLMDNLAGKTVLLSDNSFGKIVMIHPFDPLRSLVKVGDELIDLRYNKELQIVRIIDGQE